MSVPRMNWRKVLVIGTTTCACLGAGGAAMALSGSSGSVATARQSSATHSSGASKHNRGRFALRRVVNGTFVMHGKGGFVTHDVINGAVTSVSSTAITVHAADGVSQTYTVQPQTKVKMRQQGKGETSSISQVRDGDRVMVLGVGTQTLTARRIIDIKR